MRRDGVVEGLYVKRVGELHQPVGERVRILTVRGRCARMDGLDAPERFGEAAVGVVDAGAVEAENQMLDQCESETSARLVANTSSSSIAACRPSHHSGTRW